MLNRNMTSSSNTEQRKLIRMTTTILDVWCLMRYLFTTEAGI